MNNLIQEKMAVYFIILKTVNIHNIYLILDKFIIKTISSEEKGLLQKII